MAGLAAAAVALVGAPIAQPPRGSKAGMHLDLRPRPQSLMQKVGESRGSVQGWFLRDRVNYDPTLRNGWGTQAHDAPRRTRRG